MMRHLVFLVAAAGACLLRAREASAEFPCPPVDQIAPCTCEDTTTTMDLDCSDVTSADELMNIFHSTPPFPFDHFTKFIMKNNMNVEELANGIFNTIKFDEIQITNGALKVVDQGSLQECYDTLKTVDMSGNQIERFLMNDVPDMSMFTKFEYLDLGTNAIGVFPDIQSDTLKTLKLNNNPIDIIHDENLKGVPNLELIDISQIDMETLETKLLSDHKSLQHINLAGNKIAEVPATGLVVGSNALKEIDLSYNLIDDVEPGAFDTNNPDLVLNFDSNQLVYLHETTWKPLIDNGVLLKFNDNPLQCGCDLAWAVKDPNGPDTNYRESMEGTCPQDNGVPFSKLDPDWYENFCNTQK